MLPPCNSANVAAMAFVAKVYPVMRKCQNWEVLQDKVLRRLVCWHR